MPRDSQRVVQLAASPSCQPHGGEWTQVRERGRFEALLHAHVAVCRIHERDYVEIWTVDRDGSHADSCPVAPGSAPDEHWLESGCREHLRPTCVWVVLGGYPDFPTVLDEPSAGGVE